MTWKKGASGNPTGRPKLAETELELLRRVRGLARHSADEAIRVLVVEMTAGETSVARTRAATELLRWAFGDPAKVEADAQPDRTLAELPPADRVRALEVALAHERKKAPSWSPPSDGPLATGTGPTR